ncbi:MAG: hypothetical protein N2448_06415 [Caloramator sp.]|nr:hypothetical protein [Caloramator sp.]
MKLLNKKTIKNILIALFFLILQNRFAFAAEPKIVSGTVQFMKDLLTWILVLVPAGGGVMIGYHAIMKALSDGDASVIADRNRKMKNVLISCAIAESASGIIAAFLAYFK